MTDGRVTTRRHGHHLEIRMERPERRNALSPALWEGLEHAIEELHATPGLTVATLRGTEGWFCVGGDLKALLSGTSHVSGPQEERIAVLEHEQAVVRRLVDAPVLTIALIEGAATGGGFDLALACDMRITTSGAKLGASFVRLGLIPDLGGSWLLPRQVSAGVAASLLLTGRIVDGRQARELGVVDLVADGDDLDAAAAPWIEAAGHAVPAAVGHAKRLLLGDTVRHGAAQAGEVARLQAELLDSPEFARALAAFGERGASRP